ncbi:MAG: hypothetical protein QOD39_1152, partial [Mycobacterium sp.]|nr:hypothetical protein [Mycobacterium sp.]
MRSIPRVWAPTSRARSGRISGNTSPARSCRRITRAARSAARSSSIGAALGALTPLGPLGSFLGSFVGDLAGTLLGDLFGHDPHPTSYTSLWLDPATHRFAVEPNSFGGYDGGDPATLIHIAEYQYGELNTLLALSGAQVDDD